MGKITTSNHVLGFRKKINCQKCFSGRPMGLFTRILHVANPTAAGLDLRQILVSLGKVLAGHALQPQLVTQRVAEYKGLPVQISEGFTAASTDAHTARKTRLFLFFVHCFNYLNFIKENITWIFPLL